MDAATWEQLPRTTQHRARIAAQGLAAPRLITAGASAATLLGLPLENFADRYALEFGRFNSSGPRRTHTASTTTTRLLSPHHKKHLGTVPAPTIATIDTSHYQELWHPNTPIAHRRLLITSPLITCLDLARWHSLDCGVIALDHGLRNKTFSRADLLDCAKQLRHARGCQRIQQAVRLATPWSESPMESRTKVGMWRRGFPIPLQQVEFYDPTNAFIGRADFYFPSHALVVEYDGKGKYEGEYGIDRESAQLAEYFRQRSLHDGGTSIVRLTADANSIEVGLDRIARRLNQTHAAGHLSDLFYRAAGPAWQE